MSEPEGPPDLSVDYLAPFETFQAYALRRGTVYRGRIRPEFARDRDLLKRVLDGAPGTYHTEEIDGRLYVMLRVYHGKRPPQRLVLHIVLLALTALTTITAGAELCKKNPRPMSLLPFEFVVDSLSLVFVGEWRRVVENDWPEFVDRMQTGIPYAAALLFVLLSHEFGHYVAARRYGVDATLPFLIPAPLLFGTLGAIIKMRSPIAHRRALFDIGVAGPIAGLVAALVVCVIGLRLSAYVPMPTSAPRAFVLGSSPLFIGLTRIVLGPAKAMHTLELHPVAVAGWFGLFITFLNLMPLGQLDGGHLWYALAGRGQRYVGLAAFCLLVGMGLVFPGWLVLALLVLLLLRISHPPVMDESVSLGPGRRVLGIVVVVIFLFLFIAEPIIPQ